MRVGHDTRCELGDAADPYELRCGKLSPSVLAPSIPTWERQRAEAGEDSHEGLQAQAQHRVMRQVARRRLRYSRRWSASGIKSSAPCSSHVFPAS